jgi:hypothetical protein
MMEKRTIVDLGGSIFVLWMLARALVYSTQRPRWARFSLIMSLCLFLIFGAMCLARDTLHSGLSPRAVFYLKYYRAVVGSIAEGMLLVLIASGECLKGLGVESFQNVVKRYKARLRNTSGKRSAASDGGANQ